MVLSARLVSMIGTRAPRTTPGHFRVGEIFELLGQHVAGFEIGRDEDVGAPRDRRDDALGARRLQRHRVVERERAVEDAADDLAAIGHLAQRRGVDGRADVRRDRLDRGEDRHPRRHDAQRPSQVDGVLHDVALVDQRGVDVDRRVGDEQRPGIARRVDGEDVADAARGAQAERADRRRRASVRRCAGRPSSAPRPCRSAPSPRPPPPPRGCVRSTRSRTAQRSMRASSAARRIFASGTDENRVDQLLARRFDRADQRSFVDGMDDRGAQRLRGRASCRSAGDSGGPSRGFRRPGRATRPRKIFSAGRHHFDDSAQGQFAALIGGAAIEDDAPPFGVLVLDRDHQGHDVARPRRALDLQGLAHAARFPRREIARRAPPRSARRPSRSRPRSPGSRWWSPGPIRRPSGSSAPAAPAKRSKSSGLSARAKVSRSPIASSSKVWFSMRVMGDSVRAGVHRRSARWRATPSPARSRDGLAGSCPPARARLDACQGASREADVRRVCSARFASSDH